MLNLTSFARLFAALLITTLFGITAQVAAQAKVPYKTAKSAIVDAKQVNAVKRECRRVLLSSGPLTAEQQTTLKRWYGLCVFAAMTLPSAMDDPDQFPKWRSDIMKELEAVRGKPQLHAYIRDEIVSKTLKQLVVGNYHPACRYNATLIIGNLNDTEARAAGNAFAIPHAASREFLLKLINPKNKQPEAVQVAAMIGLRRHAELLRANGNTDPRIVPPMLALMNASVPSSKVDQDGYYWKKRLAIETLGAIGLSGAADPIQKVVANEEAPLWVRSAAAESLGELDYRDATNLDGAAMVKGLGKVAVSACLEEMQRIKKYDEENPDVDANRPRFGGLAEQTPEASPVVTQARRTLKYYLECVKKGLNGVGPAASDQTTLLTSIQTNIDAIEKGLDENPETTTPKELLDKIGPPAMQLEQAVR